MTNTNDITPATPFWEGYKRSPATHNQLMQAISEVLTAHPTMRFAHVLYIALGAEDQWNTYDETVISKLRDFARIGVGE